MTTDKSMQPSEEDKQAFRIAFLIAGYIQNRLSQAEHSELNNWVNEHMQNQELFEQLTDEMNLQAGLQQVKTANTQAALLRIKKKIFPDTGGRLAAAPVLILLKEVFR